jgi:hypothetical protein
MKIAHKVLTLLAVTVVFTALAFGKSSQGKEFSVYQNRVEIAKVLISWDKSEIKAVIERRGQIAHIFSKSLITKDVSARIGDNNLLTYNNKSGEYKVNSRQSNISKLKWSEIQNFPESFDLRHTLAEDMKILRAIRAFDDSALTRSFELTYVILTADESIYWSEQPDYIVKGMKNATVKVGCSMLPDDCTQGCDTRLSNCLRDVQPDQRIECYRIAESCHARCNKPALEDPPTS